MARLVREQLRNVVAVTAVMAIAAVTSYVILQEQRLRIPILEEKPFELKAEFETAQAVVPGQGQTIRVAGVRVGDVEKVELVDGAGVVTFAIDRDFLPIYRDATILMRPLTGLKSMFFELDPGTQQAGRVRRGRRRPDGEHRARRQLPRDPRRRSTRTRGRTCACSWSAPARVSTGATAQLGRAARQPRPDQPQPRRPQPDGRRAPRGAGAVHPQHERPHEPRRRGRARADPAGLARPRSTSARSPSRTRTSSGSSASCPETLAVGRETLISMREFATIMGPTFNELRPFARNLDELNASTRQFAERVTPVLKDEIRPFVREARDRLPDIRTGATRFAAATPRLTVLGTKLNRLANMATNNPGGAEPTGDAGPRRGLPLLAQLARPQHLEPVLVRRRQRLLPPRLPDDGLRARGLAGRGREPDRRAAPPAGHRPHRPRRRRWSARASHGEAGTLSRSASSSPPASRSRASG